MDYTSRMTTLLARMRRERNGAVADAMRVCGMPCGLNLGVSLPAIREIARAEPSDHAFARYLFLQDVRELRLAALHIASPGELVPDELPVWAAGIVNAEIAREAAFALLSRSPLVAEVFDAWSLSANPLLSYAALLAAARACRPVPECAERAVEAVRLSVALCSGGCGSASGGSGRREAVPVPDESREEAVRQAVAPYAARLTAEGAAVLLAAFALRSGENRQAVIRAVGTLGAHPAETYLREELAWRLEI